MIELFKWRKRDYNLAETVDGDFSILFGNYVGVQISKGSGYLSISIGTGKNCYELSIVNLKKRPDWFNESNLADPRRLFLIGGRK